MSASPLSINQPVILQIAIPSPIRHLFDYLLPTHNLKFSPQVGARVLVPFGKRNAIGIIIAITSKSDFELQQLKHATQILDPQPFFTSKVHDLFIWASQYYQYPLGLLLESAFPAWLRKEKNLDANLVELVSKIKNTTIKPHIAEFELNQDQQQAIYAVSQHFGKFKAFVLDGVTGSGKTEVYMQLIAAAIALNKQTLILVPEINLTPQTLAHFQQRFAVPIAILHSQVSEKARAVAWLQAKDGIALIVLGTRSAAFTPLKNPGLFIVDEEHDLSFKQQDHFRYSARDLLLKRAQLESCPIVLGSATPCMETWHNVTQQRYAHLQLNERAGNARQPNFELIDIRHNKLDAGLSNALLAQIKQHLDNNGQVLLFLNRRGYAPVFMCFACGWHQTCKRCDSNMIFHSLPQELRCHHCGAVAKMPKQCPECSDLAIDVIGLGTQQIEECLSELFPQACIARVDRDSVRTKKQLDLVLEDIHSGKTNILIGTQMLSKGHHFPNLTLVAIIDIDSALFSADFRATERIGQLITQVAGRAGRSEKLGTVVLQTTHPENPLLNTLIYRGYHAFINLLMQEREATKLPPFSYQVLIRAEAKQNISALNFLNTVKNLSRACSSHVTCLGPIPAPMEKRQGFYRAQLLLQADLRSSLQSMLNSILPKLYAMKESRTVRWTIDVDPLDMY